MLNDMIGYADIIVSAVFIILVGAMIYIVFSRFAKGLGFGNKTKLYSNNKKKETK